MKAFLIGLVIVLAGCMTSENAPSTYKARIYIPPINSIACDYDSVQVREDRAEYYSPEVAKKMEGCFYPYPEPKRWEAYQFALGRVVRFIWGGGFGDSANRAREFFSGATYDSAWVARAHYLNQPTDTTLTVEQWHYLTPTVPKEYYTRTSTGVRYDISKGGFWVSSRGEGWEIFIIE